MKNNCFSVHTQDKTGRIQLCPLQCSSFSHGGFSLSYELFWNAGIFQEPLGNTRSSLWQMAKSVLHISCMDTGRVQAWRGPASLPSVPLMWVFATLLALPSGPNSKLAFSSASIRKSPQLNISFQGQVAFLDPSKN